MRSNAHENYLENEVLTAEPLKLVVLLYQGALDSLAAARWQSEAGNQLARRRSIDKALAIVSELTRSLDMSRGGEVSAQLARLYQYIQGRLMHTRQSSSDHALGEVERLLSTLLEGWSECEHKEARGAASGGGSHENACAEYAGVDYAW